MRRRNATPAVSGAGTEVEVKTSRSPLPQVRGKGQEWEKAKPTIASSLSLNEALVQAAVDACLQRVGVMLEARIGAIADRLTPEKDVRPPLQHEVKRKEKRAAALTKKKPSKEQGARVIHQSQAPSKSPPS